MRSPPGSRGDREVRNDYRVTWTRQRQDEHPPVLMEAYAPDSVAEIADVIGFELATKLVLELGGADELFLPTAGQGSRSTISDLVGNRAAVDLGKHFGPCLPVPTAHAFCCQVLRGRGLSVAEISAARHLSMRRVRQALAIGMPVDLSKEADQTQPKPITLSSKD